MEVALFIGRLVLTGLLYLFLAAVFIVLWRDMRAATPAHSPHTQVADARLIVLEGNDTIPVNTSLSLQPFTTLGRGPANTIVLPNTYASAEHAIIAWHDGQWWLEDRGSRNGTLLNDVKIESPVVLSTDDIIGIGQIKLKVEIDLQQSNTFKQSSPTASFTTD